jgi:hypothetical protein
MVTTDQEVAVTQPSGAAFAGRSRLSRRCATRARSAICAVERLRQPPAAALDPTAMRRSRYPDVDLLGDGEPIVDSITRQLTVLSKIGLTAPRPGDKVQLPRRA